MDKFLKKNILISLAVSVIISLMTLGLLLHFSNKQIKGDYYWMLWPTAEYGIPSDLQEQFDLKPLWKTHGWDGQFYYYMANDLFIQKNYRTNMDGAAYRYQRIGLPLVAKAVASLLGQRFVSAKVYFFTHFIIYFLGLWLLIFIFIQKKQKWWLSLMWGTSIGTLSALYHGLPDLAADVFALTACWSLFYSRYKLYTIFMCLAALTREVFVLIALSFFLRQLYLYLSGSQKDIKQLLLMTLPGGIVIAWNIYIQVHLGNPRTQGIDVINGPLFSFFEFTLLAIKNFNFADMIGQLCYISTIIFCLWASINLTRSKFQQLFFAAFIPYLLLMTCLGPIVMNSVRDFLKGISFLFILHPVLYACVQNKRLKQFGLASLVFITTISFIGFIKLKAKEGQHFKKLEKQAPPIELKLQSILKSG